MSQSGGAITTVRIVTDLMLDVAEVRAALARLAKRTDLRARLADTFPKPKRREQAFPCPFRRR